MSPRAHTSLVEPKLARRQRGRPLAPLLECNNFIHGANDTMPSTAWIKRPDGFESASPYGMVATMRLLSAALCINVRTTFSSSSMRASQRRHRLLDAVLNKRRDRFGEALVSEAMTFSLKSVGHDFGRLLRD